MERQPISGGRVASLKYDKLLNILNNKNEQNKYEMKRQIDPRVYIVRSDHPHPPNTHTFRFRFRLDTTNIDEIAALVFKFFLPMPIIII